MQKTAYMRADEIAHTFNASRDRQYWKAVVGGSTNAPTVIFKSRTGMVELTYVVKDQSFFVTYSKVSCAFGDFMSSAYKSLNTVLLALKAAGLDVSAAVNGTEGTLRVEYDPRTREARVQLAETGDDWQKSLPTPVGTP